MADKVPTKNRFAGVGNQFDDSDDEAKPITKTQKKKEERKVEAAPQKVIKVNNQAMGEGGFNVVNNQRPQTGRGGRGGGDRGARGGRGGRGGGERRDDRPQTGNRPPRVDADGNPIRGGRGGRGADRGGDRGGRGNWTGEGKRGDRKDNTGRGNRGDKKGGEGRANWGGDGEKTYQKKSADDAEATADAPVEEAKVAQKKEPEEKYIEEIIGVSFEDYFKTVNSLAKKDARGAEGIKGEKTATNDKTKEHQGTVQKNQYLKGTIATSTNENNSMMGFGAINQDVEEAPQESGRGGRGGRGRGGRGGRGDFFSIVNQGGRRQNAKQALKKTDDDFPAL